MKKIRAVCTDCGKKYKTFDKSVMGLWKGTCDLCGKKDTWCAAAWHDFGIPEDFTI